MQAAIKVKLPKQCFGTPRSPLIDCSYLLSFDRCISVSLVLLVSLIELQFCSILLTFLEQNTFQLTASSTDN